MSNPLPHWFEAALVPQHLLGQASQLAELARQFPDTKLSASGQVSARLLFLHYWRKLALRTGTWAHIGLMPDGALARCHAAVTGILDRTDRITPP